MPTSLKVFLTALAIIDDLGAVLIIAVFYTGDLSLLISAWPPPCVAVLVGAEPGRRPALWPYLLLGAVLWVLVLRSGVHATIAGVALALTIPLQAEPGRPDDARLAAAPAGARAAHWVAFLIVPVFGFANAGVSFAGLTADALLDHLTLGVAARPVPRQAGRRLRQRGADHPARPGRPADGRELAAALGVALLCGIGFTMSLFIGLLAFAGDPLLQDEVKVGILLGSLLAGLLGWAVLRVAPREVPAPRRA